MTLFPAVYCDYFKGLSQCLAGMGIKADKFEFKGQTEMQSKIKHAYNVSGWNSLRLNAIRWEQIRRLQGLWR